MKVAAACLTAQASNPKSRPPAEAGRRGWLMGMGAALLLSACALPGSRRAYTLHQGFWRGRIALRTEEEQPQSHIASFELRGSAQQGELEVYNPLGNVMARLQWHEREALLTTGSEQITGTSLDELAARMFGTPIPVAALFAWLSGEAQQEPGWLVDLSRFEQGRIQAVRQQPLPRTTLQVILQTAAPQ